MHLVILRSTNLKLFNFNFSEFFRSAAKVTNFLNRNLKIITIINTVFVSANSLWIMFLPYFFKSVHLSGFMIGVIYGFSGLANALGRFFGGRLSTVVGIKYDIMIGYLMFSLWPIMFLTSYYIYGVVIGSFGTGLVVPAKSMFVVEQTNKRRGFTYMFVQRFLPSLFPALLLPVGAYLYYKNLFYVSLILGSLGIVSTIPLLFKLNTKERKKNSKRILRSKIFVFPRIIFILPFIFLVIAYSLDSFSSSVFSWYIPLFLNIKGYGVLFYGVFSSLTTITIAFGSLFSGYLVDKLNPYRSLILLWIILSIIVFIFALANNIDIILITYLIWNTIDMIDTVAGPILIHDWFIKEKRTLAYGYFSGFIRIAGISGLFVSGLIVSISLTLPFLLKGIFNIVGAILIFIIYKFKRHYF